MGVFQNDDPVKAQIADLSAREKYRVYGELIDLDYETYIGVMKDDDGKQVGPEGSR